MFHQVWYPTQTRTWEFNVASTDIIESVIELRKAHLKWLTNIFYKCNTVSEKNNIQWQYSTFCYSFLSSNPGLPYGGSWYTQEASVHILFKNRLSCKHSCFFDLTQFSEFQCKCTTSHREMNCTEILYVWKYRLEYQRKKLCGLCLTQLCHESSTDPVCWWRPLDMIKRFKRNQHLWHLWHLQSLSPKVFLQAVSLLESKSHSGWLHLNRSNTMALFDAVAMACINIMGTQWVDSGT